MKQHALQLGSLKLSSKAILSPMESVSDVGFRSLCFKLGASLTWTEMIRGDALCKNNKATIDLVDTLKLPRMLCCSCYDK